CALADRGDDDGTDRDVGHEAAVHHVHVELVGAAGLDPRDVVAEGGEVGGEDRGGDLDHGAVILRSGDRRKRTAVNPSVPWRWGRHRSVPSASRGSGNSLGGSGRNAGCAVRKPWATSSFSSGSSEQVAETSRPPGLTSAAAASRIRAWRAAFNGRSATLRRHFTSGLRRRTPRFEQGASTRTPSQVARKRDTCASTAPSRGSTLRSPSRATASRTRS